MGIDKLIKRGWEMEYGQYGSSEDFSSESFCEPLRSGYIPIILISGPSGVGKGSVIAELLKAPLLPIEKTLRFTSRETTDADHGSYISVNTEDFKKQVSAGEFLEWSHHVPGYYGTPLSAVNYIALREKAPLIDVDIEAAQLLKKMLKRSGVRSIDILILPKEKECLESQAGMESSLSVTLERMMQRNRAADEEDLLGRVERSRKLLYQYAKLFSYIVVNKTGQLEQAAQDIANIISSHLKQ